LPRSLPFLSKNLIQMLSYQSEVFANHKNPKNNMEGVCKRS
jgi:hypothetical protein